MIRLKEEIISLLNLGLNPTVISFEDDGLYYLVDQILQGKQPSAGYDPTFSFVHVTLNYLEEITTKSIENEINEQLQVDSYEGSTIMETLMNGVEIVCVFDDIAFVDDVVGAIKCADNLIKKFRNKLRFVYIVEDPSLMEKFRGHLSPTSSFFDAVIFKKIGDYWDTERLAEIFAKQFNKKLDKKDIEEISQKSKNFYGYFKQLYKERVLSVESSERYLELLVENWDNNTKDAFKKYIKQLDLSEDENSIIKNHEKVGFLKEARLAIPEMQNLLQEVVIEDKVYLDEDFNLKGKDLEHLTDAELEIVSTMAKSKAPISKSQIGDIIWKDEVDKKYSEWAIDQRISRLRRKLLDLSINMDIKAVYGRGFKLTKVK